MNTDTQTDIAALRTEIAQLKTLIAHQQSRRFRLPRHTLSAIVLGAGLMTLLLAGTLVAAAAPDSIPNASGVFSACYSTKSGKGLRLIDTANPKQICKRSETLTTWSQIGPKGDIGLTGAQGVKGDTGLTGAQGLKGDKGDTGLQGDKGDTGLTGAQGVKGDKGDTGAQGIAGADASKRIAGYIDNTNSVVQITAPCAVLNQGGGAYQISCAAGTFGTSISVPFAETFSGAVPITSWTSSGNGSFSMNITGQSGKTFWFHIDAIH